MTYSYSQLSHYLSCPRRYRHRYLDGWQEKDTRAAMLFGRCFEQALGAYFRREDAAVTLYREWAAYQKQPLRYSERDSTASARKIASGSRSRGRTCRSSSYGRSREAMTLSPTSMPSASSMVAAVCSNGRLPQPATQNNRMVCWRSIRSCSPIFLDHRHLRSRPGGVRAQAPGRDPVPTYHDHR